MTHRTSVPLLAILTALRATSAAPPAVASTRSMTALQGPVTVAKAAGPTVPSGSRDSWDVCRLLTEAEIRAVQGEAPTAVQGSRRTDGGLATSQCFYTLKTYAKSVVLEVVHRDPADRSPSASGAPDPGGSRVTRHGSERRPESQGALGARAQWFRLFHHEGTSRSDDDADEERERDKDKERGREGDAEREEERERRSLPKPVKGVGQEAFWVGNGVIGGLYVLKGETYIRVSVGGAEPEATRIEKTKALARCALKRLKWQR